MAQCISEEYTDAVLACYHEAGTIGIDALNEALVTEPLAVDDGALEKKTEVELECKQLRKENARVVAEEIAYFDNLIDRHREDQAALERAIQLTNIHLGFKASVRKDEGCKFLDLCFTQIVREDPQKCYTAVLRADGGFNLESTEPELQRDEEMLSKVAQAKKDSSKLKDLVRFLRKRFVQEYGSA